MTDEKHINFTKAVLLAIPAPAEGRVTYHDARTPGLQLRVTPAGAKTFCVFRRVKGGSPVRLTIGRFPDVTIEKARQLAMSHAAELAVGTDLAERQRKARAVMTFEELFGEYMRRHSKIKKRTWQQDESQYNQYLAAPLGKKRLSEISRKNIASIHSKITAEGHATTANRVQALVSSVFGWAISVDMWDQNPAAGVKKNTEKSRDRFIQGAEFPDFFRAVQAEPNDCIRDFFLMSLLTGARRANVLAMAWMEVQLADGVWRIPRTKNGESQTVMLVKEAVDILERRKKRSVSPFVFPGPGGTGHLVEPKSGWHRIKARMAGQALLRQIGERSDWDEHSLQVALEEFLASTDVDKALVSVCERAEQAGVAVPTPVLPDLRIHDLRRTLGSWQVMTGATLPVIGKSLNHRSPSATAVYARLDHDPVRAAVTKATDEMWNVGNAREHLQG
ncbi:tyrosine-type recombinase/integrase [Ralstonia mannitolilytica]|uniref:tyrosine-type recombinase/integrase n=1 Tax=Ralstonia mannitolilytica TaxID=105219 RepID=UPI0005F35632|nr:site-specific integrase [Ralstonia mannitolilytica]